MQLVLDAPRFEGVVDTGQPDPDESTGQEIRRRREALGMSASALSKESQVDRGVLAKIEADAASVRPSSIGAVRAALGRLEEESGMDLPSRVGEGLVEFRLSGGSFGVEVVVSGPVRDLPALEASVERLVREMRRENE